MKKINDTYIRRLCNIFNHFIKRQNEYINYLKGIASGNNVTIWGCGELGIYLYNILIANGIKINAFVDNNQSKWGNVLTANEIYCYSPEDFFELHIGGIILIASNYWRDILAQLNSKTELSKIYTFVPVYCFNFLKMHFDYDAKKIETLKDKLIEVINILEDDCSKNILITTFENYCLKSPDMMDFKQIKTAEQGWPKNILDLNDEEYFIDAGAYIGDTIDAFLKQTNNKFGKIYAFEMEKNNYAKLADKVSHFPYETLCKIQLFPMGIGAKTEEVFYISNGASSKLSQNKTRGFDKCSIVKLDDAIKERVTYIKMDIEGAETDALVGAKNMIVSQKPKLAISVYHSLEDFYKIPLMLHKWGCGYKLYLRHHQDGDDDTLLYAVMGDKN